METAMTIDRRLPRYACKTLATICLCAVINNASADERADRSASVCGHRDLQLVTLMEDHGSANTVAPEKLFEAYLVVMDARIACSAGRHREGIALYDSIMLGPVFSHASR
jgi:hypothetical protein